MFRDMGFDEYLEAPVVGSLAKNNNGFGLYDFHFLKQKW